MGCSVFSKHNGVVSNPTHAAQDISARALQDMRQRQPERSSSPRQAPERSVPATTPSKRRMILRPLPPKKTDPQTPSQETPDPETPVVRTVEKLKPQTPRHETTDPGTPVEEKKEEDKPAQEEKKANAAPAEAAKVEEKMADTDAKPAGEKKEDSKPAANGAATADAVPVTETPAGETAAAGMMTHAYVHAWHVQRDIGRVDTVREKETDLSLSHSLLCLFLFLFLSPLFISLFLSLSFSLLYPSLSLSLSLSLLRTFALQYGVGIFNMKLKYVEYGCEMREVDQMW